LESHLGDGDLRIIETSVSKDSYDAAHVPGAAWMDCHREMLLHGDDSSGYVIPPTQYAALMSRFGIEPETTVVWYGDRQSSFAIRGFWTMRFYQHQGAVHVLDGGRERWLATERPTTAVAPSIAATAYPVPAAADKSDRATIGHVRDAIGRDGAVVLDVRAPGEYDGTIARAARAGHMPGAVNIEWTDATVGDNVLRPVDELRELYASRGVTPDKEIIAHCQLGIRSAHTWFVLKHVLGYPNVRSYDGSWQEWGNREDTAVERGAGH
jgi:thiosulfate/3-mercaptopyruvate sulfurtransferase